MSVRLRLDPATIGPILRKIVDAHLREDATLDRQEVIDLSVHAANKAMEAIETIALSASRPDARILTLALASKITEMIGAKTFSDFQEFVKDQSRDRV